MMAASAREKLNKAITGYVAIWIGHFLASDKPTFLAFFSAARPTLFALMPPNTRSRAHSAFGSADQCTLDMYVWSLGKPPGTGFHVAESSHFVMVECGVASFAWTYPSNSIETRPRLSCETDICDRSQKTTRPRTEFSMECHVRDTRCSLRSFSFSTASEPLRASAVIINWKCQALNTKPLSDFLFLDEVEENDRPASEGSVIESQINSQSPPRTLSSSDIVRKDRFSTTRPQCTAMQPQSCYETGFVSLLACYRRLVLPNFIQVLWAQRIQWLKGAWIKRLINILK